MPRYDAYLLRVWRGDAGDSARWSGRLEHLPDGQYQRFASLEALLTRLRHLLAEELADPPAIDVTAERETNVQQ